VSGYGQNPGVKLVDPTPGEYTVLKRQGAEGTLVHKEHILNESNPPAVWTEQSGGLNGAFGTFITSSQYPVFYDSTTYNNALSDFYDGLRRSEANFALSLGEAKETRRTLLFGKTLPDLVTMARRTRRQFLHNPSKSMAEIWLAAKYGWAPLIQDVYAYLKWSYDILQDGIPIRGRANRVNWVRDKFIGGSGLYTAYCTGKQQWKCEVKCWVDVGNSALYNSSRITTLNPASIAWELMTLSFVVDWFYDVGGFLQNVESALGAGLVFKRGYVTEVCFHDLKEADVIDQKKLVFPWYLVDSGYAESSQRFAMKRRTKLTGFPFPRAPTLELKLGWQRIISTAALLRTILLGKAGLPGNGPPRLPRKRKVHRWEDGFHP
jgi:hypothetical protein